MVVTAKESQYWGYSGQETNLRCILERCHYSCVAGGPKKEASSIRERAAAEVQLSNDEKPKPAS